MPKHNQSARLGDLTDFAAVPDSDPDARITALERRVATLESLLNDVMQQLDQPFRDQPQGNGKPKLKQEKPVKVSTDTPTAQEKRAIQKKQRALEQEQQAASAKATAQAFEKLQALLANGDRLTEKDLKAAGLSSHRLKKVQASQAYKESGIKCEGAKGQPREYWVGD